MPGKQIDGRLHCKIAVMLPVNRWIKLLSLSSICRPLIASRPACLLGVAVLSQLSPLAPRR